MTQVYKGSTFALRRSTLDVCFGGHVGVPLRGADPHLQKKYPEWQSRSKGNPPSRPSTQQPPVSSRHGPCKGFLFKSYPLLWILTAIFPGRPMEWSTSLISPKLFMTSFCKSQFPHKSVNLFPIITNTKNKLTDLCGNRLLQNDLKNTLREIKVMEGVPRRRRR